MLSFNDSTDLEVTVERIWRSPPIQFNNECISRVRNAARTCNFAFNEMVSGAGHDSVYISSVAPTSMIFIPCDDGVSHNELENTSPEFAGAGANVLLHSVLASTGNYA